LPWVAGVVSADKEWINRHLMQLWCYHGGKFLIGSSGPVPRARRFEKVRQPGLSSHPGRIHVCGSSGYAALGVAYLLGARRIYLLGLDYKYMGTRWFTSTDSRGCRDDLAALWAGEFDAASSILCESGVTVITVGMESRITAFPKIGLTEFQEHIWQHHGAIAAIPPQAH